MPETFKVTVERNRLRFAAAHMATFDGGCERLHGHNYEVIVEAEGLLTEDSLVWDFGDLKQMTAAIIADLDHKFLLQANSKVLEAVERGGAWRIKVGDSAYVLPHAGVMPLPIDNTTAERLAGWVGQRLWEDLRAKGAANIRRLTVGIEEMPGQTGWYTVE